MAIEGVEPTFETISSTKYSVARPLFVYIKKQHLAAIPGLKEFVQEYASDKAIGQEGYLIDRGLVPFHPSEFTKVKSDVKVMKNFVP